MNKFKKITAVAVSTVMAGTLAFSLTACKPKDDTPVGDGHSQAITNLLNHMVDNKSQVRETTIATGWTTAKDYWTYLKDHRTASADTYNVLNSDGSINYSAYAVNEGVNLNLAVGYSSDVTGAFYQNLGSKITLPDGKTYQAGDLKPAWQQLSNDLHISFTDKYQGWQTSENLRKLLAGENNTNYADVDLFTSDLSYVVQYAAQGQSILNFADYLDEMPNFKAFLEANPIVYLSLLQEGMSTENGSGQVLYVAPYFDGYDDIERYCIIRQDWAKKLLDGDTELANSVAYKDACAESTAASSYMGTTGNYKIESTNADGTGKVTIVKNYDAALAAAKDASTALGKAYNAIAGAAYAGESGNIVEIMNAAIAANNGATGAQLLALYRAYIDVCYQTESGSAYYAAASRSNLFNGYDACWDVDDLVAMLRCAKTNAVALTGSADVPVEGIVPRSGQNDRTPDIVSLACQLYGARGGTSRYEYTYIDSKGELQDARNDADFYEAFVRMNTLTQEGLIADYSGYAGFGYTAGINTKARGEAFMMYDYSQTQTLNGFYAEDSSLKTTVNVPSEYYFSPIVTPVSKWDVDGDGNHTDIMRFTESWRSTKTSGLALNGALANPGNEAKLKAALMLVDYLYSADGQIVSTYGPMATNANGDGGFWYNEVATDAQVAAKEYFSYKGVKYAGSLYKGKYTPTITTGVYNSFKGFDKDGGTVGWRLSDNTKISSAALSFTNYARMIIGSTLPVGVKDQSFENQLTSLMGQAGTAKVGVALANETIKGMNVDIDSNKWWYTCVPTGLPIATTLVNDILNNSNMDHLMYTTGKQKSDKNFYSVMNYIVLYGMTGTYSQQDEQITLG